MPLDPKAIVQQAAKVGLIEGHGLPNHTPRFVINALEGITETVTTKVKLPSEAGIARPPQPTAKRPRPKADPLRRKWITASEARKLGYSL